MKTLLKLRQIATKGAKSNRAQKSEGGFGGGRQNVGAVRGVVGSKLAGGGAVLSAFELLVPVNFD